MHSLACIASLLSLALPALASNGYNICSKSPYSAMLPLSSYPKAMSYCSANYPVPGCTIKSTSVTTKTSTVCKTSTVKTVTSVAGTSTKVVTPTTTTTTVYTSTATSTTTTGTDYPTATAAAVTQTSTASSTVTTTIVNTEIDVSFQTNTIVTTETDTVTETASTTTTITTTFGSPHKRAAETDLAQIQVRPSNDKRDYSPRNLKRGSPPMESLYCSLTKASPNYQCTACSCIETPAPCPTVTKTATVTTTSVKAVTTTSATTATVTQSVTATSIVNAVSTSTVSVGAVSPTTVTPTVMATITVVVTNTELDSTTLIQINTEQATTTTTELTTTTTTSSFTATATAYPSCNSGLTCIDGNQFETFCGQYMSPSGYSPSVVLNGVANGAACLQDCSNDPSCNLYNYFYNTQVCQLYYNVGSSTPLNFMSDPSTASGYYTGSC